MALLSKITERSLFDKTSYSKLQNSYDGAYSITITFSKDGNVFEVTGLMNEGLSINVSPEYEDLGMGSVVNNIKLVQAFGDKADSIMAFSGIRTKSSGFVTKKFYDKSGYLELNPSFRVVNWDGSAQPVTESLALLTACLPSRGSTLKTKIEGTKLGAKITKNNAVGKLFQIASGVIGETFESAKSAVGGVVNLDTFGKAAEVVGSPPEVTVRISNYFYQENMIIEDLSIEFSKEMTASGPLYADIKLKISSSEMMAYESGYQDKIGLSSTIL